MLARAGRGDLIGQAASLLSALSYGLAGIYGRRFRGLPPLQVETGQVTASTLILIPLAAVIDQPWHLAAPLVHVWLALVGIALLCTGLAYLIYFRILAASGATYLLSVTFLLPVSAMLLGVAERVAMTATERMAGYLLSDAFTGPYLANQLLLPFAPAGAGAFTTVKPSQHSRTATDVIARFPGRRPISRSNQPAVISFKSADRAPV